MEWQSIIYSALGIIVTGLVSWGTKRLIVFLNKKVKNKKLLKHLTNGIEIAASTVNATYKTYIQTLKNENNNTPETRKEALTKAIKQAEDAMSEDLKNYITDNFGDINIWIKSQIEIYLDDLTDDEQD